MFIVNARFLTQSLTSVQHFSIEISKRLKEIYRNEIISVTPKNIIICINKP